VLLCLLLHLRRYPQLSRSAQSLAALCGARQGTACTYSTAGVLLQLRHSPLGRLTGSAVCGVPGGAQHVLIKLLLFCCIFCCIVLLLQLRRYPQLPRDVESLAALCSVPGRAQDITGDGKFQWRGDIPIVAFGKYTGEASGLGTFSKQILTIKLLAGLLVVAGKSCAR
jgi:hypothetical protein